MSAAREHLNNYRGLVYKIERDKRPSVIRELSSKNTSIDRCECWLEQSQKAEPTAREIVYPPSQPPCFK